MTMMMIPPRARRAHHRRWKRADRQATKRSGRARMQKTTGNQDMTCSRASMCLDQSMKGLGDPALLSLGLGKNSLPLLLPAVAMRTA